MARGYIGCSGFNYQHWRGVFYPDGLAQKRWFAHYCGTFSTVELNVTFYRLVKPQTFEHWRDETPDDFIFSVKGSRFITHIKRLEDVEGALERFFEGVLRLEGKLGCVLWQLPPGFASRPERLGRFLEAIAPYRVRSAFEFRHESWLTQEVFDLCAGHGAALCMADAPQFNAVLPDTADFVYIRRHGQEGTYAGCYTTEQLRGDAERIRSHLARGRDVFIYFNNDWGGFAPQNAVEVIGLVGEQPP